jgi:hypothetical protein
MGSLPYSWRRALDLSSQIFGALGFLFLASVLLWLDLGMVRRTTVSPNKVVVAISAIQDVEPFLASHGGEGQEGKAVNVVLLRSCSWLADRGAEKQRTVLYIEWKLGSGPEP